VSRQTKEGQYAYVGALIAKEYPRRPGLFGPPAPVLAVLEMAKPHGLWSWTSHLTLALSREWLGECVYVYNDVGTGELRVSGDTAESSVVCASPEDALRLVLDRLKT